MADTPSHIGAICHRDKEGIDCEGQGVEVKEQGVLARWRRFMSNDSDRPTGQSSGATDLASESKKSIRFPDPPVFSDGKDPVSNHCPSRRRANALPSQSISQPHNRVDEDA